MVKVILRVFLVLYLSGSALAIASDFSVNIKVLSKDGVPLNNIVVTLKPEDAQTIDQTAIVDAAPKQAVMNQINQQFTPHILVVEKGTLVTFPQNDSVRHHVYSFSPAKTFEISIQASLHEPQILFDQPGIVELGCNIHDWMLGYLYIADTDIFGKTDKAGLFNARISQGRYTINLWHHRLANKEISKDHSIKIDASSPEKPIIIRLNTDLLPSLAEYDDVEGINEY